MGSSGGAQSQPVDFEGPFLTPKYFFLMRSKQNSFQKSKIILVSSYYKIKFFLLLCHKK